MQVERHHEEQSQCVACERKATRGNGRVGLYHARKHVGKAMERLHASCFFVMCAVEVKACRLVPCVANLGVEARPLGG